MRIKRTIATLASIAMLAFTLLACEEQKAQAETTSSPEEVAALYVLSGAKMDIETMKKITTGQMLEKMLLTESTMKSVASSKGKSYEEFMKEMAAELSSKGELVIKSSTKVSENDDGKWKVMDTPK
ncbi:MAG: hypothetical protein FWF67_04030 [Fibromonadales bacterium]|nr:hypothetical protein [Fibromonadales bacterium]